MNQNDAMAALQVALVADVPVLLWGEPGAGKTAAVNRMAAALGWPIETVLASLREPSDFAGLPAVIDGSMRFVAPDWACRLAGTDRAICFFDEISTAAPSVQKALLRVVHERVAGDLALGSGVRMIAAANDADVAVGGWDLAPPLANRFLHLRWEIDPAIVAAGIAGHWPDPAPLDVPDDWQDSVSAFAYLVAGFLGARPGLAHVRPTAESEAGRAWPSPRSWEAATRVLAVADAAGVGDDVRLGLLAGLVGDGAAIEFARYERDLDLPDPEKLLADPTSYRRPPRDDQVHAVVAAVVAAARNDLTTTRWEQAMAFFAVAAGAGTVDIAAGGVRALAASRPLDAVPPASLAVFGDILAASGLAAAARRTPARRPQRARR
jgi:hypothetical protein